MDLAVVACEIEVTSTDTRVRFTAAGEASDWLISLLTRLAGSSFVIESDTGEIAPPLTDKPEETRHLMVSACRVRRRINLAWAGASSLWILSAVAGVVYFGDWRLALPASGFIPLAWASLRWNLANARRCRSQLAQLANATQEHWQDDSITPENTQMYDLCA